MPRSCALIVNRKAANHEGLDEAVAAARENGADLDVFVPWDIDAQSKLIDSLKEDEVERIIAGGGDGTINVVMQTLVGDGSSKPGIELGVLPLGTANDFARGCDLPLDDLTECLQVACNKEALPTDIGIANGRPFINVTSGGLGAEITSNTPKEIKDRLGGAAYTLVGLVKAFNYHPYSGRLLVPGEDEISGSMLLMAVGNNRFAGGGFEVARRASLDDGLLDLAVLAHESHMSLVKLASELAHPDNPDNQYVYYRQLPEFTIETDDELQINLDGEPVSGKRFEFSILEKHLRVVRP